MIGSIASNYDIEVYLEPEEIVRMAGEKIEGCLIKAHLPKLQGIVSLCIDDEKSRLNGQGIGVDDSAYGRGNDFRIDLYMSQYIYEGFVRDGSVGLRHRALDGSKVRVYDSLRIGFPETSVLKELQWCRDNKERLG
ncbi:hypothetical protein COU60_02805 [Candidatus Pacearchaeota archaeon CG10_big_fil_rev_8_21_14_0_10_34_76]|nr:MAG: hypothetical protein COU60_02805 [Candidatus Pacearchaeota archaeon CG10_big_fil_rev_8_21_14_0_10_34_76]